MLIILFAKQCISYDLEMVAVNKHFKEQETKFPKLVYTFLIDGEYNMNELHYIEAGGDIEYYVMLIEKVEEEVKKEHKPITSYKFEEKVLFNQKLHPNILPEFCNHPLSFSYSHLCIKF